MKNTARIEDQLKEDAMAIYREALVAVEPSRAVEKALEKTDDTLKILKGKRAIKTLDLNKFERIFIVGGGKATAPMAQAVEQILGPRITDGVISVKYGHGLKLKKTTVLEAGHPVPDEAGVEAAWKIKDLLSQTTKKDLVFSLISGGGSALLPLPAQGLKLSEKQTVTKMLLNCGADIHEMNVVRKHLSQIKGGQMARLAAPATVVNLMLSDVVGDSMDTIASGPFVPDKSTFEEVAIIFARYKLMKKIPAAVRNHLIKKGLTGQLEETPKPGAPEFKQVTNLVVGSNFHCLKAAAAAAKARGYKPLLLSSLIEGDTTQAAKIHAAIAKEARATGNPVKPPACIISGGETTVTVKGKGLGGRNQEFALAAAMEIDGLEKSLIFSAGTDGTDGPTDAAGALADGTTLDRAVQAELTPLQFLQENDAYNFFKPLGDLVVTGPTKTNVMDVHLILLK